MLTPTISLAVQSVRGSLIGSEVIRICMKSVRSSCGMQRLSLHSRCTRIYNPRDRSVKYYSYLAVKSSNFSIL